MEKEREQLVYLARLAEQAERYDGALYEPFLSCFYGVCTSLNLIILWIFSVVLLNSQDSLRD